jgi:hypothetical protein
MTGGSKKEKVLPGYYHFFRKLLSVDFFFVYIWVSGALYCSASSLPASRSLNLRRHPLVRLLTAMSSRLGWLFRAAVKSYFCYFPRSRKPVIQCRILPGVASVRT